MPRTNTPPLGLTRDQLATFLKDHEQIKAFENLFAIVEDIAPDVVQQAILAAGNAQAGVAQALGAIAASTQALAVCCSAADSKAGQALDQLAETLPAARAALLEAQLASARAQQAVDTLSAVQQQVDLLATAPPPREFKRARYGSFYDTTTQTAAFANVAYPMQFDSTSISVGVFLRDETLLLQEDGSELLQENSSSIQLTTPQEEIEVDSPGLYNIQFSAQLDNAGGGTHFVYIWLSVNGSDVPNSASQVRLKGNDSEIVAAWNFFYEFKAGDYFQLMWSASNTDVKILNVAATPPVPAIPSVILTVANNIQGVQ